MIGSNNLLFSICAVISPGAQNNLKILDQLQYLKLGVSNRVLQGLSILEAIILQGPMAMFAMWQTSVSCQLVFPARYSP